MRGVFAGKPALLFSSGINSAEIWPKYKFQKHLLLWVIKTMGQYLWRFRVYKLEINICNVRNITDYESLLDNGCQKLNVHNELSLWEFITSTRFSLQNMFWWKGITANLARKLSVEKPSISNLQCILKKYSITYFWLHCIQSCPKNRNENIKKKPFKATT